MEKLECPNCRKPVLAVRKYRDGGKLFIHSSASGELGFGLIDGCYVCPARPADRRLHAARDSGKAWHGEASGFTGDR
jgi:hypothetical protein